ncbi:uncharacterized protein LOC144456728 [Phascolarctos cinereus]
MLCIFMYKDQASTATASAAVKAECVESCVSLKENVSHTNSAPHAGTKYAISILPRLWSLSLHTHQNISNKHDAEKGSIGFTRLPNGSMTQQKNLSSFMKILNV